MPSPFNVAVLSMILICACAWHWAGTRLLRAAESALPDAADAAGNPARLAFHAALLALYRVAWTGAVLLLSSAAASVADMVIAVPLAMAGLAALMAQASAAALASLTHRIPAGDPARRPARAAFGMIMTIGLALPVIILLMAAAMIGPQIAKPGA